MSSAAQRLLRHAQRVTAGSGRPLASTQKSRATRPLVSVPVLSVRSTSIAPRLWIAGSPANTNRLLPAEPQDDVLWQILKAGRLWSGHLPATSPRGVQVAVLNGTSTAGLAGQAAASLKKLGFDVVNVGNAPVAIATTTVSYSGGSAAGGAYALAGAAARSM